MSSDSAEQASGRIPSSQPSVSTSAPSSFLLSVKTGSAEATENKPIKPASFTGSIPLNLSSVTNNKKSAEESGNSNAEKSRENNSGSNNSNNSNNNESENSPDTGAKTPRSLAKKASRSRNFRASIELSKGAFGSGLSAVSSHNYLLEKHLMSYERFPKRKVYKYEIAVTDGDRPSSSRLTPVQLSRIGTLITYHRISKVQSLIKKVEIEKIAVKEGLRTK